MKRFAFITLRIKCWPVRQCRLLGVSPSGYYAWQKRIPVAAAEPALPVWQLAARGACFADLEGARFELAEYLDHYDNTQRLHVTLGYCAPLEIELHYLFNLS